MFLKSKLLAASVAFEILIVHMPSPVLVSKVTLNKHDAVPADVELVQLTIVLFNSITVALFSWYNVTLILLKFIILLNTTVMLTVPFPVTFASLKVTLVTFGKSV